MSSIEQVIRHTDSSIHFDDGIEIGTDKYTIPILNNSVKLFLY